MSSGRTCILIDDIVDSGGTLVNAAAALLERGAREVYAYITHGVLSPGAAERVAGSALKALIITDSIQATEGRAEGAEHRIPHRGAADRRSHRPDGERRVGFQPF